jgi:hypothetical protein
MSTTNTAASESEAPGERVGDLLAERFEIHRRAASHGDSRAVFGLAYLVLSYSGLVAERGAEHMRCVADIQGGSTTSSSTTVGAPLSVELAADAQRA